MGLSNELTEVYTTFVGLFGLKHWVIAYDELEVEPSGTLEYTKEFLSRVILQGKPIVLFVPVITKWTRVTRYEIDFFLDRMKSQGEVPGLVLVFDAYDLLPLSILKADVFGLRRRSPERSLRPVVMYLADIMGYDQQSFQYMLKHFFENLLITCIKKALIDNVPEKRAIYDNYRVRFEALFLGREGFSHILRELVDKLIFDGKTIDRASENIPVLCLLDSLLFHGLAWFGSRLQPTQVDVLVLKKLEENLEGEIDALNLPKESFSTSRIVADYLSRLKEFLSYLSTLFIDILQGIHWIGISNFETSLVWENALPKQSSSPPRLLYLSAKSKQLLRTASQPTEVETGAFGPSSLVVTATTAISSSSTTHPNVVSFSQGHQVSKMDHRSKTSKKRMFKKK